MNMNAEQIGIAIGIAGIALAIIAMLVTIYLTKWADKKNIELARKTGALSKPRLIVKIIEDNENFVINSNNNPKKIFSLIYLTKRSSPSESLFIEFPLILENHGDKNLEDIIVIFEFAPKANYAFPNELLSIISSLPIEGERSYTENELGKFVSYKIKSLNPSVGVKIQDYFRFALSEHRYSETFLDKNKIKIKAKLGINFKYLFFIQILAKDYPTQRYKFELQFYNTDNNEEFISNYKNKILKEKEEELKKGKNQQGILEFIFTKWFFISTEVIDNKELNKIPDKMYRKGYFKGKTLKPKRVEMYIRVIEEYLMLYVEHLDKNIFPLIK